MSSVDNSRDEESGPPGEEVACEEPYSPPLAESSSALDPSRLRLETSGELPRAQVEEQVDLLLRRERFDGPLPHPRHFAAYEEILPGSAERILAMAESQTRHRQKLEGRSVDIVGRLQSYGQWMAFLLGMTCVLGGMVLIGLGHSIEGAATALSALAALVGLFVWSRHLERRSQTDRNGSPAE